MERLTGKNYKSFLESYISIYDNGVSDTQELQEQENIQEFLEVINELVEEGYDLSEYTYDELYEHYLSEAGLGQVLKAVGGRALQAAKGAIKTAWQGTVKNTKEGPKFIPGGKQTTKEILARTGKVAPLAALALAADQALTGGAGREWAGHAIQKAREAAGNIPRPDQTPTVKTQPQKSKEEKNPYGLNQDFDPFDAIKGHLLDEGYADTEEAALAMMANMSEDWRQSIIEGGFPGTPATPRPGDAGASGLKLIRTPGGQTGYTNRYSSGETLPTPTVNKIMSGQLMVKSKNNNKNIA